MIRLSLCILILLVAIPTWAADLDTMIGQMLMIGFRGTKVDNESPIIQDISERHLGGVILFDYDVKLQKKMRNIQSPQQTRKLTQTLNDAAKIPLFIGIDQEGGKVQRLKKNNGFPETPSAKQLGALDNAAVYNAGLTIGQTLAQNGFNLDFAPVADVNINTQSPAIGLLGRSFSTQPKEVTRCCRLFLQGLSQNSVIGCLKHFPGHGSAGTDSHQGLTDVTNTWSKKELMPYKILINEGRVDMIMTAHIYNANLDKRAPATLSSSVIFDLLRRQLGFDGVIITDDMNMRAITDHYGHTEAIALAIEAGADILLFGNNLDYTPDIATKAFNSIRLLIKQGRLNKKRITRSYERIIRLKKKLGLIPSSQPYVTRATRDHPL